MYFVCFHFQSLRRLPKLIGRSSLEDLGQEKEEKMTSLRKIGEDCCKSKQILLCSGNFTLYGFFAITTTVLLFLN
jgi:hypothetical protein